MSRPELVPVTSSNLAAVGYDAEASTLYVEFQNGAQWRYPGVTAAEHAALVASESIGRAFAMLKAMHTGERVS